MTEIDTKKVLADLQELLVRLKEMEVRINKLEAGQTRYGPNPDNFPPADHEGAIKEIIEEISKWDGDTTEDLITGTTEEFTTRMEERNQKDGE